MKILHTADWHIGKKLHKHDLSPDFDLFIIWLCNCIQENKVELLLISGDVFDLANPSSEARKQYYRALLKLRNLDCKIILTGGNHDSPAMLDAPGEILKELDMHVIGSLRKNLEDCIIPVKGKSGKIELVVAALPYLRDADLRSAGEGNTYEDRLEVIRMGIQNTFLGAAEICKTKFPDIPALAMGHLYAAGVETSESERDIQIGNQAAFHASQFGDFFNYIALGHIHKPQKVNAPVPTYYSGSPIPLSFSERKDEKRVLILDTEKAWIPESIPIPVFRKLLKISGTLSELNSKLLVLESNEALNSLIELEMIETQFDANKIYELDKLNELFDQPGFEIVKSKATFLNQTKGASELYANSQQLEDLKPRDVFLELIAKQEYNEEMKNDILSAFDELLEEVHATESSKQI
ncbi:exodeoxyribonuclease I subunit D [Gillisia sp. Hel_I_86]|uniref:exonuclease subunit SbcD n=1 Tax=Gillisia sp. Hel_I_86 TaxID=1249981 RepID=UPI00119A14A8|nr:exonuclease subunit SbcD [Gillisia sp. Hel_I_86]TVZ28607.1 exodeoxyribonuclease I subunit D [Gillisia sp. Hel_I_86]